MNSGLSSLHIYIGWSEVGYVEPSSRAGRDEQTSLTKWMDLDY